MQEPVHSFQRISLGSHLYTKDHKTYEEQLAIIESRNLPALDKDRCLLALRQYGYYRLSAYWYPFRIRSEDHVEGVDVPSSTVFPGYYFDDIIEAYELDKALRHIVFGALDQIEIAIRVAIAYQMGQYDRFALENIALFSDSCTSPSQWDPEKSSFDALQESLAKRQADANEDFVEHFESRYGGRLPVWSSIETWDFGTLNSCYQILRSEDKVAISNSLGVAGSKTLGGWIDILRYLRNKCAHHSRLNRRYFANFPKMPKYVVSSQLKELDQVERHRLYPVLVLMQYLLSNIGDRKSLADGLHSFSNLVGTANAVTLIDYGFPDGWENLPLWRNLNEETAIGEVHSRRKLPLEAVRNILSAFRR